MELQTPKEFCNGESGGGIMDSKEDYFQNNVQVALSCLPSGCVGFSNSMLSCASGRIDVLKPNPGKAEDAAKFSPLSTSFGDFHLGDRKGRGLHCHDKGKNLANDMKPVRKWSSSSGFRGVDNHAKQSEMMMFSSKKFSNVKNCYRSSIYYPGRSYMAEKAKKQISERWRMTKEFQDGLDSGNRGRSRTLGEMLAMSDHESNPEHSYDKLDEQRLGNRINPMITVGSGCMQSQGVPYLEPENEHLIDGNYVIQNKVKNSIEKNDLSGQHSVASELSRHVVLFSSSHATREAWLMHKDQKNKIKDGNLSGQNSVGSELIEVSEEGFCFFTLLNRRSNSVVNSEAQLSPVSVLETFEDEISSCSDFSKSIDAGLHG
ncbi:hypothetical protein SLEP1_g5663 [Rubroshorea leprosula]|nr:hypothetical protein SLEP1_g5663 [Rubroshorea leprosula]